jgi:CRP/FNR family cyclic AMP-dependent transcriptional regulator
MEINKSRPYLRLPPAASDGRSRVYRFILEHGIPRDLAPRTPVYHFQDSTKYLYAVESGMAKVFRSDAKGGEFTISLVFPGDPIAIAEAVIGVPHTTFAETIVASRIWVCPVQKFLRAIATDNQLALSSLELLAGRLLQFHDLAEYMSTLQTPARIGHLLVRMANEVGELTPSGVVIRPGLTHEEISHLVSATRPFTTMALHQFEAVGLLHVSRKEISIPNIEDLLAFCEGEQVGVLVEQNSREFPRSRV